MSSFIEKKKVATKNYALTNLYYLGKNMTSFVESFVSHSGGGLTNLEYPIKTYIKIISILSKKTVIITDEYEFNKFIQELQKQDIMGNLIISVLDYEIAQYILLKSKDTPSYSDKKKKTQF